MRIQITLEPEQHARAKQAAATSGISMAEYIRRLVERDLASSDAHDDPSATIGIGRSGDGQIAAEGKSDAATIADLLERARGRTGGNIGREAAVEAVRTERDAR